jgi:threonine efflux protein
LSILLTVGLTHILALMSPGPDLVLVIRNALGKSRVDGYFTALGFAVGVTIHLSFGFIGLSFLISKIPTLLTIIQLVGCLYLVFIGWKSWRADSFNLKNTNQIRQSEIWISFKEGLVTNLLNVKAMLFFMTLLVTLLTPDLALSIKLASVALMFTLTFIWFAIVTRFLTIQRIQERFFASQRMIEKVLAILLWLLALKLSGLVERLGVWLA